MIGAFAVYLRVSTDKQDSANQEPDLVRLLAAREPTATAVAANDGSWWTGGTVYRETGSAMKVRPAFDHMMEDARLGKFRRLYVWALDRFGRNQFQTMRDLALLADTYGVAVISVRDPWVESTADPLSRKLLLSVLTWAAEAEHTRLKERTVAGLARAKASGKVLGRRRVVIPEKALAKACELRQADGGTSKSWRDVAAEVKRLGLGDWSHASLARQCTERVPALPRGKPGFPGPRGRAAVMSRKGRF